MSLRFQRLILILLTLIMLGAALLLILFNTKQNIVFFYTPSELLENNIAPDKMAINLQLETILCVNLLNIYDI